ncbi:two component transcriptional regulator, LuxR family [Desulfocicer vacuolatum DSM 3385]|uniref:Two component transcriptional regulator, LuxR family n=1 Tax=Desulfocicer vacuolatum DSM 3385 TaxID=1121400 RepID=A0A1W2CZ60_9BACT|nr:response regulator transcription factor [Desulfocicer vacuolatum]SMC90450.1 two component transcriptional regulator, LuxR family [Desulfocicer vacuolatum DSM 3385]
MIRIFIVEDHPIFRMGIEEMINQEPDMTICGHAEDVPGAIKLINIEKPDLVIVDLSLKESNGLDLIKEIHLRHKPMASLVLSMHDEAMHAERCIMAGAKGYIMKQEASESVVTALRRIMDGHIHVSPNIMSQILHAFQKTPSLVHESRLKQITDRELEIFQLIGAGLSSKEIAGQLNISIKTIGTHRERIKEKLHLKNASELVRYAVIWVETGIFKGDA